MPLDEVQSVDIGACNKLNAFRAKCNNRTPHEATIAKGGESCRCDKHKNDKQTIIWYSRNKIV